MKNDSFKLFLCIEFQVMHHSEYIDYLIKYGRIKVDRSDLSIVYHDPCELGRGCKVYDEPRRVLQSVGTLRQAEFERENAFCCGNTMGNAILPSEKQQQVRDDALDMLTRCHPDVLATACPLCKKTFAKNHHTVPIKDIAEIVAENC